MTESELFTEAENKLCDILANADELDALTYYISGESEGICSDPQTMPYTKSTSERIFTINSIVGEKIKQLKENIKTLFKTIRKIQSDTKNNEQGNNPIQDMQV